MMDLILEFGIPYNNKTKQEKFSTKINNVENETPIDINMKNENLFLKFGNTKRSVISVSGSACLFLNLPVAKKKHCSNVRIREALEKI